jgi:uracil-DNA glycosylase
VRVDHVKFRTKAINVKSGLTLIVGQNPGRQRNGCNTGVVWEGNRSGDYITQLLAEIQADNVYLTNVCNYQVMTAERIREGLNDIRDVILEFEPERIICLGDFSYKLIKSMDVNVETVKLYHPSYVLRFNRDREEYKKAFTDLLFHV